MLLQSDGAVILPATSSDKEARRVPEEILYRTRTPFASALAPTGDIRVKSDEGPVAREGVCG